jgi:acyl carrier protein
MKNKSTLATSLIKKIKPANYKKIISYKGNLIDDGLLDSFDIIKICSEIETISKKKIPLKKLKRENFINLEKISKLI